MAKGTQKSTFSGSRSSRLLALAVTLVLIALVAVFVVLPIQSYSRSLDERLTGNRRMIGLLSKGPEYQASLVARYETLRQRVGNHGGFVSAETESLAAAQVVDKVQRLVDAAGGNSRSTEVLPSGAAGPDSIRVRAILQAQYDAATRIIADLEAAEPFMFIDRLHIRSDPASRAENGSVLVEIEIAAERLQ